ncbi:MAG: adenylosuccinate synthase [Acidobacteriota bacterium]
MSNVVIVGAQWGDEGKGKIVDLLTEKFDIVARYQGGHNAGHTVHIEGRKYVLHLIPAGILHPGKVCVIGNGVVIEPFALFEEIETLRSVGVSIEGRLFVSNRAHLIMPYHMAVESAEETSRAENKIGTTSRGIGPAYEDKMGRRGVRAGDLRYPDILREKIRRNVLAKNDALVNFYKAPAVDAEEIYRRYLEVGKKVLPLVIDTAEYLNQQIAAGKSVLFEGAQGTMLDVDHGTYPFVTASNSTVGGACTGTGVGPTRIDGVIGIAKAYTTRVGAGPFPTELEDAVGEEIRRVGAEFGASTGRPRRCGWFDAVVVRFACLINAMDTVVITKLDVLDQLDEIKICVGYAYRGERMDSFPTDLEVLEQCKPIYETHPGWKQDTSDIRDFGQLPFNARSYLDRLAELIGTDISIISTGPDRTETIVLHENARLQSLIG